MYCHGVQWLVGAARILAERSAREGRHEEARGYLETAYRLWLKISSLPHVAGEAIETYGGQPNQQAADMVTTFDPGRMIWNGYTGAAGWMFRQALEGVLGLQPSGRGDGPIDVPGAGGRAEPGRRRSRSDAGAPCSARRNYAPPRSGSPANNPLIRLDIHGQHPREDEADGNHLEPCATSLERRAARRQRPGPRVRLFPEAGRLDQSRRGG